MKDHKITNENYRYTDNRSPNLDPVGGFITHGIVAAIGTMVVAEVHEKNTLVIINANNATIMVPYFFDC